MIEVDAGNGFLVEEEFPVSESGGIYESCRSKKATIPSKIAQAFGMDKVKMPLSAVWFYSMNHALVMEKIESLRQDKIKYCLFIPVKGRFRKV